MMRQWFGSWGQELDDNRFCAAVIALGLVPASARRGRVTQQGAEEAVCRQLAGDPPALLRWSLQHLPTERGSWASRLQAEGLAAVVEAAPGRRRLAIVAGGVLDAVAVWRFLRDGADPAAAAGGSWSFSVEQRAPATTVRFRWPVRVGSFVEPQADPIAAALKAGDRWAGCMYLVQKLNRRLPECDVLPYAASSLGTALEELSARSAEIGGAVTDLLVIALPDALPETLTTATIEPLRGAVDAAGVLLLPLTPSPPHKVVIEALSELSRNAPLDVAVARVSGGAGLLVADPRLVVQSLMENRLVAMVTRLRRLEIAGAPIKLHRDVARMFDLRAYRAPRGHAAKAMKRRSRSSKGAAKTAKAGAVGRVAMALKKAAEARDVPRFLQTGIESDGHAARLQRGPLAEDTPYRVAVFVGERNPAYLSDEAAFPTLPPPKDGHAHRLTVVLWEPQVVPKPKVKTIELPPTGDSSMCRFAIRTRRGMGELAARISVLHRNRVLQSGVLRAPVGAAAGEPSFRLDAIPRARLSGLDERTQFDLAFVLNESAGGGQAHAISGDHAVVLQLDDDAVAGLVNMIGMAIGDITAKPDSYAGLRSQGSVELLRTLAQKGASLRKYLAKHAVRGGKLTAPSHVQVVSAHAGKVFPVEFMYELEAPEDEADLCEHAEQALQVGMVDGCCPARCPLLSGDGAPAAVAEDALICPLAFWGVRCVIERRPHTPETADFGGDYQLLMDRTREPGSGDEKVLRPGTSLLVAATPKANQACPTAVADMCTRLSQAAGAITQVTSWKDWVTEVAAIKPTLLTLVVHQEKNRFGTRLLDLGSPPPLKSDLVKPKHVWDPSGGPPPIALVIGCETALAGIAYENVATRFHDEGAAVVVSTIAKVLGREAAPVVAELVEEMARATQPTPFAEILGTVRRRLLLAGTPMVLSLTAIGDADWQVVWN